MERRQREVGSRRRYREPEKKAMYKASRRRKHRVMWRFKEDGNKPVRRM